MSIDMTLAGATLAACPVSALVLSFALFGFAGWAWESTVCAMLNHGHFANSGFLLGPCCPIYGVGGVVCWLLLHGAADPIEQFMAAALICSVIEYGVGVLLEKTTGARFWDYSHLPLNLHGRICLYWACAFGLGALAVCRVVEPAVLGFLAALSAWLVRIAAAAVVVALAADTVFSLASWRRLSEQLECVRADLAERINDSLRDASDSMLERIPDSAIDSVNMTHVRGRAINAWLAEITDAALEAARERASMPAFVADGRRGLSLAARRVADTVPSVSKPDTEALREAMGQLADRAGFRQAWECRVASADPATGEGQNDGDLEFVPEKDIPAEPSAFRQAWERRAPHPVRSVRARMRKVRPVPRISLRPRELRFFNAFPRLSIKRYEGVIRATNLAEKAREQFRR